MGCSQILFVGIPFLQVDLVLFRFVDMGFNGMFSDPFCRYTGLTSESVFNQIGGQGFQWDILRSAL